MSMLDAPVSGSPTGARQESLTIMVGGHEKDVASARDILQVLGSNIFHLGPLGAGETTKLVNQLMSGGVMTLISEAMAVADRAGLDLNRVVDAVSVSSGNSTMFSARHHWIIEDRFIPGFKSALMHKDMSLACV